MNSILLFPGECSGAQAVVEGERATELVARHDLKIGLTIRTAVLGGARGRAYIKDISSDRLLLELILDEPSLPLLPVHMIVGLCRPQTVKKLILIASTFGISRLDLVKTAQSQKSYLQSKVLQTDEVQRRIYEGLEQSGASLAPQVQVYDRFKPYIQDELPQLLEAETVCLLANVPKAEQNKSQLISDVVKKASSIVLAIGPEAGWSDYEQQIFVERGFVEIDLGLRMLRTEMAASALLGQLQVCCGF